MTELNGKPITIGAQYQAISKKLILYTVPIEPNLAYHIYLMEYAQANKN